MHNAACLHYAAILMMTSQILKSAGFRKTQKSRYLENETLFFLLIMVSNFLPILVSKHYSLILTKHYLT